VTAINHWPTRCLADQTIALLDGATLSNTTLQTATVSAPFQFPPLPNGDIVLKYTYSYASSGFGTLLGGSPSAPPALTYNPSYSAFGALIEDCSVVSNRGIGIVVRSVNTEVSHCVVSDTIMCGIHAGGGMVSAYPWGGAGAPPHHLSIHDCVLTRNGTNPFVDTKGAIEIAVAVGNSATGPCNFTYNPVYSTAGDVILDVTLQQNAIRDFPRAGIFAANVGGLQGIWVLANSFSNSGPMGCRPEYGFGVAVESCGAGLVQGNQFLNCAGVLYRNLSPNVVFVP
jgi:hypothetical protein